MKAIDHRVATAKVAPIQRGRTMTDNSRERLIAAAALARKARSDQEEARDIYREAVLREYPRLVQELHRRLKDLLEGIEGIVFSSHDVCQTLTYTAGSSRGGFQTIEVGQLDVPELVISFLGRSITFRPAGIGFIGALGKIEVITNGSNVFPQESIFMDRAGGDIRHWTLAIHGIPGSSRELTDDVLRDAIDAALMQIP